jgi:enhancer of mRNA-decapping protein 3
LNCFFFSIAIIGKIARAEPGSITITNAFHNGIKLKKFEAEVTIEHEEIENISFIQLQDPETVANRSLQNTPVVTTSKESPNSKSSSVPTRQKNTTSTKSTKSPQNFTNKKLNDSKASSFNISNLSSSTTIPIPISKISNSNNNNNYNNNNNLRFTSSTPTDVLDYQQLQQDMIQQKQMQHYSNNHNRKKNSKNYDLMQPDDFSDQGDFDFETNNAKFDKKSIFQEIEAKKGNATGGSNNNNNSNSNNKPDLVRQTERKTEKKYRHDENVLDAMFVQFRNIQLEFKPKQQYTTDEEGIIIPSIPQSLRNRIQNLAAEHGYSMERQNEFLARGATELALQLLGGSRRFMPKNLHQYPRVTIICDEPYNFKKSEIGLMTGRQLASHGVNVMVYVKTSTTNSKESKELELYTASGNDFTGNVKDLAACDLVIMSVSNMNQNSQIIRYIQENRSPVMAIDPPVGINAGEINIRNTVIPILPLDDIQNNCGKLHLVNLCISEKFFKDTGIKYFPIFGSKFVIPLHLKT